MPQKEIKEKIIEILEEARLEYISSPKLANRILELLAQERQKLLEEIEEHNAGILGGSIIISRDDWESLIGK